MKAQNSIQVSTVAAATSAVANPYASLLTINTVPPPCRKSIGAYYMHKFYSRIKPEFDRVYAERCAQWDAASEERRQALDMKEPAPVALRQAVTKQCMEAESDEFLAELQSENESDFEARMQTWVDEKRAPTSPQQFHK